MAVSDETLDQLFAGATQGFIELQPGDLCHIDNETVKALELVSNILDGTNKRHTLFGYLNTQVSTTSGMRLLRESVLHPLCHIQTIEHRLDCIEYLVAHPDILGSLSNLIRRIGLDVDLDNIARNFMNLIKYQSANLNLAERRLEMLSAVNGFVSQVSPLLAMLAGADQETLNVYRDSLEDPAFQQIIEDICSIIEVEVRTPKGKRARMYKIRSEVDHMFDIARNTYLAALNDMEQYVRELNRECGLSWKLTYSETRGYYLSLTGTQVRQAKNLDICYLCVNRTRNMITCMTKELREMNNRAGVSYENSMKIANDLLVETLNKVQRNLPALIKLIDVIGILDLTTGFAKLISQSKRTMTRPRFTPQETIIIQGRHPVLDSVLSMNDMSAVANDATFRVGLKNFLLITGPNMGGKSVYLKQVALIQIMAQLGCYVPAESAHIKLMNRIVVRTGTSDDYQSNCSSFMWEMKGVASAFVEDKSVPNHSTLYIIDEVGRGTSIDDGTSYSFAIAEELATRHNCFTVFATHFEKVFQLPRLYRNVEPYHFVYDEDVDESTGKRNLKLNHHLFPGIAVSDHYGIKLAEACGLPLEVLSEALKGIDLGSQP